VKKKKGKEKKIKYLNFVVFFILEIKFGINKNLKKKRLKKKKSEKERFN